MSMKVPPVYRDLRGVTVRTYTGWKVTIPKDAQRAEYPDGVRYFWSRADAVWDAPLERGTESVTIRRIHASQKFVRDVRGCFVLIGNGSKVLIPWTAPRFIQEDKVHYGVDNREGYWTYVVDDLKNKVSPITIKRVYYVRND